MKLKIEQMIESPIRTSVYCPPNEIDTSLHNSVMIQDGVEYILTVYKDGDGDFSLYNDEGIFSNFMSPITNRLRYDNPKITARFK